MSKPPTTGLAVCAIFRDEARYLREWIAFHRLQGVARFYLYNNNSVDSWADAIAPYIASGVVEVSDWPHVPGQGAAYEDCLRQHRQECRWIAFLDIDEFLFSPSGRALPDVLSDFEGVPGVVVNWRMYGTNGWARTPEGLVIENYQLRAPDDYAANSLVKSIVNPRKAFGVGENPAHYFRLQGNPVGEDMKPALHHTRIPATAELLRINHYYAKSDQHFRKKASRPRADFGVITDRPPNPPAAVRDTSILRFVPAVKDAIFVKRPAEVMTRADDSL